MMAEQDRREAYLAFSRERRQQILERIANAAQRAGRDPQEIDAVAVSKTVDVDEVLAAHSAGWTHFAENRPQELERKLLALEDVSAAAHLTFDMIGHLQTNKINHVLGKVRMIHSIRSEKLAEAVAKRSAARGLTTKVLLEINIANEPTKSGMSAQEALSCAQACLELDGISLAGLMAMAPAHNSDAARKAFSDLRDLRDTLRQETGCALDILSCGMSDDFAIAVEEGSTLVRLGRVAFDPNYELV